MQGQKSNELGIADFTGLIIIYSLDIFFFKWLTSRHTAISKIIMVLKARSSLLISLGP